MSAGLERAEPGRKRVLSGMVADTLALVRADDSEAIFKRGMNFYFGWRADDSPCSQTRILI